MSDDLTLADLGLTPESLEENSSKTGQNRAFSDIDPDYHLSSIQSRATDVLGEFLNDPSDKNRLRAAQLLLQSAARFNAQESRRPTPDQDDDYWPEPQLEPKVG